MSGTCDKGNLDAIQERGRRNSLGQAGRRPLDGVLPVAELETRSMRRRRLLCSIDDVTAT